VAAEPGKANTTKPPAAAGAESKPSEPVQHGPHFPVVALGASAGGLEALEVFFEALPADTGMAFVVVTHQLPGRVSLVPEILSKHTKFPVVEARDRVRIEPDRVYVSPPGSNLAIVDGTLLLMAPSKADSGLQDASPADREIPRTGGSMRAPGPPAAEETLRLLALPMG